MIYVTIPTSEDRDDFEVYQRNQYVSTVTPVTTLAEIIKHCPEVREEVIVHCSEFFAAGVRKVKGKDNAISLDQLLDYHFKK